VDKVLVFNYSDDFPFLWNEIKAPVQFGSNYKKETEILENFGKEIEASLK
jgi:small-conductance mechanosensitive channel